MQHEQREPYRVSIICRGFGEEKETRPVSSFKNMIFLTWANRWMTCVQQRRYGAKRSRNHQPGVGGGSDDAAQGALVQPSQEGVNGWRHLLEC